MGRIPGFRRLPRTEDCCQRFSAEAPSLVRLPREPAGLSGQTHFGEPAADRSRQHIITGEAPCQGWRELEPAQDGALEAAESGETSGGHDLNMGPERARTRGGKGTANRGASWAQRWVSWGHLCQKRRVGLQYILVWGDWRCIRGRLLRQRTN